MDEDLAIIESKTRSEKIKNFFLNNKNKIIFVISSIFLVIIFFFGFDEYKQNKKIKISDLYNSTIINYSEKKKETTVKNLVKIINEKDTTYSPLSLYFIIDNNLVIDKGKMNDLFSIVIDKTALDKEVKNLIIYKKGLFYADEIDENGLLEILNPLINSKSIWKSHALYLAAEYFYAKNEKQKSKDFFNKIIGLENSNQDIKIEAQKRINRDFSD